LRSYNKINVRELIKESAAVLSCEWSTIRYDPEEEDAARELKPLVEKIVPSMRWELFLANTNWEKTITLNTITLLLESKYLFSNFSLAEQANTKSICEALKR
jgi:hypothetical protein